jgi:AcrR family transcriptional regulator
MLEAAIGALQRDGVAGMSFTGVLDESGAARGAIYHHFPGGKRQLVAEAASRNAEAVREGLAGLPGATPSELVEAFLTAVRPVVRGSAGGGGCAVAAVTVGVEVGDDLRALAARQFESWIGAVAQRLRETGLSDEQATDLATTLIVLLEGAHVLCRAAGDLEPFERAARLALAMCERTTPVVGRKPPRTSGRRRKASPD